jgi:hypothetical protein
VHLDHETRSSFLRASDYFDHVANAEVASHMSHLDLAMLGARHRYGHHTVIADRFDSSRGTSSSSGDDGDSIVNGKRAGSGEDVETEALDGGGKAGILFRLK